MRIVYVIEKISCRGGMERILIDKMNYLAEHTAHEIVLMTVWHDDKEAAYPIHEKVRRVHLNVPVLPIPFGYQPSLPWALHRFNKIIRKINPSCAVFFRAVGAFLCASTSWKGKKIFESHTPYRASNHNWIYPYMQRKVDAVVCLTNADAEQFTIAKRVEVIPNFTRIAPDALPNYATRNVVFVGRDCPEKDIPRLKRIWNIVQPKYPDWKLSVHHQTQDIISAYLSGSILVMTSKAEGFGLVLVEAMSCGLPCVAFDCPDGPREIIEDGVSGYLIPFADDQAFIDRLSALIEDESLRAKMGEAAKASSKRFEPAPIMEKWLKLFASLSVQI